MRQLDLAALRLARRQLQLRGLRRQRNELARWERLMDKKSAALEASLELRRIAERREIEAAERYAAGEREYGTE